jgi:DNA polymerase iota
MKYLRSFEEVKKQLHLLGERLIQRMQVDLLEEDEEDDGESGEPRRRWMAHPRTLRLSTRPRPPPGPDGIRARTFQRISRSAPMPGFVFQLNEATSVLADKLVEEALVPMFRKLHHEKAGWNLSLINVAATNMAETAAESKDSEGRDIGRMFRRQDEVLRDFKVTVQPENVDEAPTSYTTVTGEPSPESLGELSAAEGESGMGWESDDSDSQLLERCDLCHSAMPAFALSAHRRYHELINQGQITP